MARILVVDDEPSLLQMLKVNLELEGHEAFLAGDGQTALKRIEAEIPDLVLLDIMMPVFDGWEVLRRIGQMRFRRRPRVVVMTAKAGTRDYVKGLELGAHGYVTKPFDLEDFLETVREVLSLSEDELETRRLKLLEQHQE